MNKYNQKYSRKELVTILDSVIDSYEITDKFYYFWWLLLKKGISRQYLNYYINVVKDEKIVQRVELLRELQEAKLANGMLDRTSDLNPITSLAVLKCNYGWIEEEKRQMIEVQKQKLELGVDGETKPIDVTFKVIDHRSQEEIDKLVDGKEE